MQILWSTIGSATPLKLWSNVRCNATTIDECSVQEFITPARQWNQSKLVAKVGCAITNAIIKIPLPTSQMTDRLGNSVNEFSVSKAYRLLSSTSPAHSDGDWRWVWRLSCSQRIRSWCWKVFKGRVLTKSFLYTKELATTLRCPHCETEAENPHHLLLQCP